MSIRLHCYLVLACGTLLVGCYRQDNPFYCPGAPDDNCAELDGGPRRCTSSAECAAPTAVCDVDDTKTCVQCVAPDQTSACAGTTPVCGTDHVCQPCAAHDQCASLACAPDGSCAAEIDVAYVAANGSGSACTRAAPCGTLDSGLQANKPFVKIANGGPVKDTKVTTIAGRTVKLLADPGAQLDVDGDNTILEIRNTGTDVEIYDLEIVGATGVSNPGLSQAAGEPKLLLVRVKVTGNQGVGVATSAGALTITQSAISGNQGGGILITGGSFAIVGNVFFNNGDNAGVVGGVSIATTQNAANRLEFNSFNKNTTMDGIAPAIQCVAGTFTARNNILSGNGTLTNLEQIGGTCAHAFSIVRPGTLPAGTGNLAGDPLFRNTTTGDLHIQTGSSAIGAADPGSDVSGTAARDIDGDPRTNPTDIGADVFRN